MTKLSDYELRGLPQQAIDMLDDIRDLLNSGKYQGSVATTGIPGWSANTGEFAFFSAGSDRRVYLRSSTAWQLVAGFDPTLLPSALGTVSAGTGNVFSLVDHIHTSPPTPFVPEAGFNNMQAFTSNGTWNLGTGTTYVFVELWGAGGGGGGGGNAAATNATSGGTSRFAGLSAVGGGSGGTTIGGIGGTAAGGVINITGQAGQNGVALVATGSGGGTGGNSPRGGAGGSWVGNVPTVTGTVGSPPGGGGGSGGKAADAAGGGGGGAGGYCAGLVTVAGSPTVSVQVGVGGTGGNGSESAGGAGAQGLVMVYWAST